ncbi:hypothetical protein CYMTET_20660 [Cymbomonas tetramitiformis]|uniref:Uncharacterized protein n=1 Tax=Cymbomonas tetramitiformis TaxID=36881 RepID=A0AAE0L413_9CHLO|nr:hypothetical protein CYMTET_20660 [Cymbomonas tetramitiformis]
MQGISESSVIPFPNLHAGMDLRQVHGITDVGVLEDPSSTLNQRAGHTPRTDAMDTSTSIMNNMVLANLQAGTPIPARPGIVIDDIPAAPRKKGPPDDSPFAQGLSTSASASRCRERLAAAARYTRRCQSPMQVENEDPYAECLAPALERSSTYTGPRKRLDETLDELSPGNYVTPKKLRGAEDMFASMQL